MIRRRPEGSGASVLGSSWVWLIILQVLCSWAPVQGGESELLVSAKRSKTESTLMSICFRSGQVGWAVGSGGTILKTVDGGQTWNKLSSGTTALLTAVFFLDGQMGWVTGSGELSGEQGTAVKPGLVFR